MKPMTFRALDLLGGRQRRCAWSERFAMRMLYLTVVLAVAAPPAVAAPVALQNATATFTQGGFLVNQTIDGNLGGTSVVNGWAVATGFGGAGPEIAVYETQTDVGGPWGATLTFSLTQNFGSSITLGGFRFSVTSDDRTSFADGLTLGGDVTANWIVAPPITAVATNGATLTIREDSSILAGGASPATTVYTVTAFTDESNITGIRLETLEDPSLPAGGPGRAGNGNFVLQEFQIVDAVDQPAPNADFDENGSVDGDDLARWLANFNTGATHMQGNADGDGDVDGRDFLAWQRQLGGPPPAAPAASAPEPAGPIMATAALAASIVLGRRKLLRQTDGEGGIPEFFALRSLG